MKGDGWGRSSGKRRGGALFAQTNGRAAFATRPIWFAVLALPAPSVFRDAEDDTEVYGRTRGVAAVSQLRCMAERAGDAQSRRAEAAGSFFNTGAIEAAIALHGAVQARFAFTATFKRAFWIER